MSAELTGSDIPSPYELKANVRNLLRVVLGPPSTCLRCGVETWALVEPITGRARVVDDSSAPHVCRQDDDRAGFVSVQQMQRRILTLFAALGAGQDAACRGCGRRIWWLTTKAGKKAPYTAAASIHFADCPAAKRFKGGRK